MKAQPTRLVLLGHPVSHSLSPLFQNAALRSAGVPLRYEALDIPPAAFDATWRSLGRQGAAGNVTIPHKERAAELCLTRTPLAERVGAVNTFWSDAAGALHGDNTDVGGFEALVRHLTGQLPARAQVALLGAGGGAAAVLTAAEQWDDCQVVLYNRTATRAARLAARFPIVRAVVGEPEAAVRGAGIVINASAAGLSDDTLPVPVECLEQHAVVIDLVYRPGGTSWVHRARARGLTAGDGLPMLVEQGALAFERWLGIPAPREVMWRAIT